MSNQPSELKEIRRRDVWFKLESKGTVGKATSILQRLDESGDVKKHMAKLFDAVDSFGSMNVCINGDLIAITSL